MSQYGIMHCPIHFFCALLNDKPKIHLQSYTVSLFLWSLSSFGRRRKNIKRPYLTWRWCYIFPFIQLELLFNFFYRLQLSLAATGFDYRDPSDLKIPREKIFPTVNIYQISFFLNQEIISTCKARYILPSSNKKLLIKCQQLITYKFADYWVVNL